MYLAFTLSGYSGQFYKRHLLDNTLGKPTRVIPDIIKASDSTIVADK